MIGLKYREDLYAEKILAEGFISKYHVHEMKILVKYFKSQGIKPKERKEMLYAFCEKYIKDFNRVLYFKKVNAALNAGKSKNNNLIIIKEVPVMKNELDYINSLPVDYNHKKIIFTLLIQNKINKLVCDAIFGKHSDYNFFGGKKQHFRETFSQSKVPSKTKIDGIMVKYNIHKMINHLDQNGIIKLGNRGRIILSFIDDIQEDDKLALTVTSFDDIGYYYDFWNGENNVIKCEVCNRLVKKTGKNHRMCKECWKEHRRKYNANKQSEYRNKIL